MLSSSDYKACVDLTCRMNSDPSTFTAFQSAMAKGGADFAAWLHENGVPKDVADDVASLSGDELFTVVGRVVCGRFW